MNKRERDKMEMNKIKFKEDQANKRVINFTDQEKNTILSMVSDLIAESENICGDTEEKQYCHYYVLPVFEKIIEGRINFKPQRKIIDD